MRVKVFLYSAAIGAAVAGGYALSLIPTELDKCAKEHGVYSCHWEAVPSQETRTVYVRPELLPEPAV
jgi:hypothetical protein